MAVYSSSILQRVFAQLQAANTPRTIPNSSGTWTNTGSILTRHAACSFTSNRPVSSMPYKTGNRSSPTGIQGRTNGTFTWSGPLIPSGAAGTAPDLGEVFFKSIFGQAGVVVASTSVTYSYLDSGVYPIMLSMFDRSGGSSPTNLVAVGCIPQRVVLTFGGEYLMMSIDGKCVGIMSSTEFSSYTGNDAVLKAGLTSFPTEPSSGGPVTVTGSPIPGFGGTATFASTVMPELRGTYSITINTGFDYMEDAYQDGYPFAITAGRRSVFLSSLRFLNSDQAGLNTLKVDGFTKTAFDAVIAHNTGTAGAIVTATLKSIQLPASKLVENGNFIDCTFGDAETHASAVGNTDNLSIAFT